MTLLLPLLLAFPSFADMSLVGGLRRSPFLGAALKPAEGGVSIDGVVPGSTAEKIGLQAGDLVVSVDGKAVAEPGALVAAIKAKRAGDAVSVSVRRGGETLTKTGTLTPVPLEARADYLIEYGSVDAGGAKRRVIVTRPRDAGKHPAVLLIGGIGCYSLDGILRPPELRDAYATLLDSLTRAGYVTMRVEKSGMGDSDGPPCADPRSDFESEVRGAAAGLTQLRSLEFVDNANVFLFAHSIGPLVAARVAAAQPVRGIVVAETIGTSWLEYDLANMRRQMLLSGAPYDEVDRRVRHHETCVHKFFVEKRTPEEIVAADKTCAPDLQAPAPYTYMQQVASLDLAPLWKTIDAPVLILYGSADFVTDDFQHRYLRDMINAFHPGRATYVRIEGMDHGLYLAGTPEASMNATEQPPVAKQFIDETLRFLARARA